MLKFNALFLLITIFVTGTLHGQNLSATTPKQNRLSLQETISLETEKIKKESAAVKVDKSEKIRRQNSQKSWDTKSTLIIGGVVVALVALAVVLALTTKRCIKRSPSGCNFANDTNCQCLEYAK